MKTLLTLEQLATTTHYSPQADEIISALPSEIRTAAITHNHHELRQLLSGKRSFSDARTVARIS